MYRVFASQGSKWRTKISEHGYRGFTVAELIVAMVVTAICLLGIQAMLQQALEIEHDQMRRVNARARASAVVNEIARALESAIVANKEDVIILETDREGRRQLICIASLSAASESPLLEQRRYVWIANDAETTKTTLQLQRRLLSGTKPVDAIVTRQRALDDTWNVIPPTEIAKELSTFSVQLRSRESREEWSDSWRGLASEMRARIIAAVDGESVERIVNPRVDAPLVDRSE